MISKALVKFYRLWHGTLRLKGAGRLLTALAKRLKGLQDYPLILAEGQIIRVDFRDVSAMYWLNYLVGDAFEEQGLLLAIKPFLKDGIVVWDIGANSGLFAYQLVKMNHQIQLHFFEPNPRMFQLACEAVAPFRNVASHDFGLSDHENEFTLVVPAGHATMGTLEPQATGRHGIQYKIACRAGDNLIFSGGYLPPDLIKIDTEGHEVSVIAGLLKTLALHRPIVFFENISVNVEGILRMIPPGYRLLGVSDINGELKENFFSEECHNSVLLPS